MAIPVEYATTSDGVRIAYARRGRGPVVVSMAPLPVRHIQLEWESPDDRRWLERLGAGRTLIRFDPRGHGLSDRTATLFSLEAQVRDLAAVIEQATAAPVALFAAVNTGPVAIAYAVAHPERVSHLILWCASTRAAEGLGHRLDAVIGLVEHDWELATETAAHLLRGWSSGDTARRLAAMLRACVGPATARGLAEAVRAIDVADLLPRVRAPTLVLQRREVTWVPLERAVELGSRIPGARLVVLEGASMAPWAGDMEAAGRAVDEFLGDALPGDAAETRSTESTFRREGDYWTLAFAGTLRRLRDAKGLHHIAYLLARPTEPVPAAELLAVLEPPADGARAPDLGDAGPALDPAARRAYRLRLGDLRAQCAEAERAGDPRRAHAARAEIEFIEGELAAALGLGNRTRRAASAAERARLTATKRIRDAVDRIRQHHPALAAHLDRSLRTGLVCVYVPGPEGPARWML